MKKYLYLLLTVAPLLFPSCSDDDKLPVVTPTGHGTVTDDQGNTYEWVRIGDLQWTTSNAKNGPEIYENKYFTRWEWVYIYTDKWGVDDDAVDEYNESYRTVYGNLMNYQAAVASAPEGWRLPTDEDWQKLERALGMSGTDKNGRRGNGQAFRLQEKDGGTELAMQLGGAFLYKPYGGVLDMGLVYQDVYGYFWTSTIDPANKDEESAYFRKILGGQGEIWRESASTNQLMSVRWVKDAE